MEAVINSPGDLGCKRSLEHLDELSAKARACNARLMDAVMAGQGSGILANPVIERIAHPTSDEAGRLNPEIFRHDRDLVGAQAAVTVKEVSDGGWRAAQRFGEAASRFAGPFEAGADPIDGQSGSSCNLLSPSERRRALWRVPVIDALPTHVLTSFPKNRNSKKQKLDISFCFTRY